MRLGMTTQSPSRGDDRTAVSSLRDASAPHPRDPALKGRAIFGNLPGTSRRAKTRLENGAGNFANGSGNLKSSRANFESERPNFANGRGTFTDGRRNFADGKGCFRYAEAVFAKWRGNSAAPLYGRGLVLVSVGKSAGTGCVTLPVAAHSTPRRRVVAKPTSLIASRPWPSAV